MAPSTSQSSSGTPPTQSTPMVAKKFIGAVEDHWELFSDNSSDYTLGPAIGFGASSIVYSALYQPQGKPPPPVPCALKVLDLDKLPPRALSLLQRETTLMSLSKHPNVLRVRGSWMDGHKLYIALRLMNKGSAADVMHYGWPGGMEEDVIKCILKQALQGLNYLHINGFIHRDVKAANLLIDDDGTVLLGDLGVAANLAEDPSQHNHELHPHNFRHTATAALSQSQAQVPHPTTSSQGSGSGSGAHGSKRVVIAPGSIAPGRPKMGKRKSFVGTPCWMAPELIQQKHYDSSADIWSFAITALELTLGRPPRSRESQHNVLLRIVQEAPPTLDREGGTYKYSKAFQEMVESCLVKDPSKRPTAEQLLQTPFFKGTKKHSYLVGAILKDLPPLAKRQERRALPSAGTRTSIDSWDFATTIHSPGTSMYRRTILDGMDAGMGMGMDEAVFDMEGAESLQDGQRSSRSASTSRSHLRAVSWAEEPEEALVGEEEAEAEAELADSEGNDVHEPNVVPSSPSSSHSESDFPISDASASEGSSPAAGGATPPSSVDLSDVTPIPIPTRKSLVPPVPIRSGSPGHSFSSARSPPNEVALSMVSSSPASSVVKAEKPGLWNKIKKASKKRTEIITGSRAS